MQSHRRIPNSLSSISNAHSERIDHVVDDEQKGGEHTDCLERIGPYQRLNATAFGIEPDKGNHSKDNDGEQQGAINGRAHRTYDIVIQKHADDIETSRRTCHF